MNTKGRVICDSSQLVFIVSFLIGREGEECPGGGRRSGSMVIPTPRCTVIEWHLRHLGEGIGELRPAEMTTSRIDPLDHVECPSMSTTPQQEQVTDVAAQTELHQVSSRIHIKRPDFSCDSGERWNSLHTIAGEYPNNNEKHSNK